MRIRFQSSHRERGQAKLRRTILLAGSVVLFLFCAAGLIRYVLNARQSASISRDFQEIYYSEAAQQTEHEALAQSGPILRQFEVSFPSSGAEERTAAPTAAPILRQWPGNPSMKVSESLKKLQRQNKDIIGWLAVPGMLEQAVVQRNNTYYLKRDYLGYHNANGALFLEEGISLRTRPDTYIIFGHNMKTGDMFGSLRLYEDVGYYRRHALINFNVLYEDGQYVVFSIADVDIVQGMRRYVPFMQLPGMPADERAQCIQKLQAYSLLYSPVQVSPDDQLLLLVTCEGTEENRRVVAARRLRDGENADMLQTSLQTAKRKN